MYFEFIYALTRNFALSWDTSYMNYEKLEKTFCFFFVLIFFWANYTQFLNPKKIYVTHDRAPNKYTKKISNHEATPKLIFFCWKFQHEKKLGKYELKIFKKFSFMVLHKIYNLWKFQNFLPSLSRDITCWNLDFGGGAIIPQGLVKFSPFTPQTLLSCISIKSNHVNPCQLSLQVTYI